MRLLLYRSRTCRAFKEEREDGKVSLKLLLERLRYLRFEVREREGGMGPEKTLSATEKFCRFLRKPTSGERVPVRLRPEMSTEMTTERWVLLEEEEQMTPCQVQWWVVGVQEERDFCRSSVMADFMANRALYSDKTRPWMRSRWSSRKRRNSIRIVSIWKKEKTRVWWRSPRRWRWWPRRIVRRRHHKWVEWVENRVCD